jgi:molybdenum cofactor guanylyltransferase
MSAVLLDGPRIRARHTGISQRPGWFACEDFNRRRNAVSCGGRVGALRRPYHFSVNISAALLAGGESRRMGTDKADIRFRGKLLWQNQLDLLRQLNPTEIFVSARVDPSWRPGDVHFVADTPPSRGPLSGLTASIERMSTSHLLALAIDMPWMSKTYLEFLCAQIESGCGIVPKIGHRAEPLAAIYPQEAATEFRQALTGHDFSLQSLVRDLVAAGKLRHISVTPQDKKLFLNVNSLSDLPWP